MMITTAMAHQRAGIAKLDALRVGALFMEMGTGKSRTFYEIAERKLNAGKASRTVVLCPVSGKDHLADEALKHTGVTATVHGGRYGLPAGRINIIGIESMSTSISAINKLEELSRDAVVIIDESQLIKGRETARTRHIQQATSGSRYRYISSGLAMPNGVEDLWSQMQWLSPAILSYSNYAEFSRKHLRHSGDAMGAYGSGKIIGRFNTDVIAAKIAPYAFESRKADCLDLPPKTYSYRTVSLSDEAKEAYAEAKRRILFGRDAFDVDDSTVFRLFTALQMISSGVKPGWLFKEGEYDGIANGKLDQLRHVIGEATGKAVVWCRYIAEVDAACRMLDEMKKPHVRIDGGVHPAERKRRIGMFRHDVDVLVSTLQVGGTVHDWGFADYAIYISNTFDYMLRAQSEDRTHRAMMTGKAHYIDIRSDTGIEKNITRSLNRKENALKAFQDKLRQLRQNGSKEAKQAVFDEIGEL